MAIASWMCSYLCTFAVSTEHKLLLIQSQLFVCPRYLLPSTARWRRQHGVAIRIRRRDCATDRSCATNRLDGAQSERCDKRCRIPDRLAPISACLRVDANHWLRTVDALPHSLRSAAGRPGNLRKEAQRRGLPWLLLIDLTDAHFGNRGVRGADLSVVNANGQASIFDMVELLRGDEHHTPRVE